VIIRAEGVFRYIQEIWGFISPGIVAAFLVGLIFRRVPAAAAKGALLLGPVLYAISRVPGWIMKGAYEWRAGPGGVKELIHTQTGEAAGGLTTFVYEYSTMAFLHHMAIIFIVLAAYMLIVARFKPLEKPVTYPRSKLDTAVYPFAYWIGGAIVAATVVLYVIFY